MNARTQVVMPNNRTNKTVPVWEGAEYPRVAEGRYSAVASRIPGPEWVVDMRDGR